LCRLCVAAAGAARRTSFDLSGAGDELAKRREHGAEVDASLLGLTEAAKQARELPRRDVLSVCDLLGHLVDPVLEPQAFRVELECERITIRQGRLDLVAREAGALRDCVEQRANPLQK
jgi:hypothetical protein